MEVFKNVLCQGSSPALAASKTVMPDQEDMQLFVFPKDSDSLATQHLKNISLDISFEALSSTTQSSLLSSSPFQHTLSPLCSSPQKSTHTSSSSKSHSITEKRAQQNRKAQRAFRERKEKYISGLESKLKELECRLDGFVELKVQFEDTRIENEKLRCENQKLKATISMASNDHQIPQPLPISVQTPTISPTPSVTRTLNQTPERDCYSEGTILMNTEELFSQSSVFSYMSPQFQDQLIFQEGDFLESVTDSSKSDIKFVIPESSFYNCLQRMYN